MPAHGPVPPSSSGGPPPNEEQPADVVDEVHQRSVSLREPPLSLIRSEEERLVQRCPRRFGPAREGDVPGRGMGAPIFDIMTGGESSTPIRGSLADWHRAQVSSPAECDAGPVNRVDVVRLLLMRCIRAELGGKSKIGRRGRIADPSLGRLLKRRFPSARWRNFGVLRRRSDSMPDADERAGSLSSDAGFESRIRECQEFRVWAGELDIVRPSLW